MSRAPVSFGAMSTPITTQERPPVLVIDDEYGPRESIAYSLSQNFSVDAVARAVDGLERLRVKRYDVVIMDIRMPGMDGIRAVSELRKIDGHVSVIMLTGYGTLQTAQQAMLAGANQYLRKPPDVLELNEAVARQAAESRLRRTQADAARAAVEMSTALKEELSAAAPAVWLGKASAELVHDIANPLTIVIGYADLLSAELQASGGNSVDISSRLLRYTEVIRNASEYCRHLSQNWRRSSGGILSMENLDLGAVICQAADLLFENRVVVEIDREEECLVRGVRFELMRVVQNIIKNSIEAGASLVRVQVLRAGAGEVVAVFEDNGGGMSDAQSKAVAEAAVSFKEGGTGLGLGICRHIMAAHGGRFELSSKNGAGATVRLAFPSAAS